MKLKNGDRAPDFTLLDQNGHEHRLSSFKGKWVLIYFYPKDDTPGCTKEACALRDEFAQFQKLGAEILGISSDSVRSHEKFARKYDLPFILLADEKKEVVNLYGVWGKKKFMGREYEGIHRVSFLIDAKGKIAKVYETVKPVEHAQEIVKDLAALKG